MRLELTFAENNIANVRTGGTNNYNPGATAGELIPTLPATTRADIFGMVDVIYSVTSDGLMTASD